MVLITAVHMEGGSQHEHIASVRWKMPNGDTGQSSRQKMVEYIEEKKGTVGVTDGRNTAKVGVYKDRWLRTYADRTWTDNLLALPRY